jgi:hypothetical protein
MKIRLSCRIMAIREVLDLYPPTIRDLPQWTVCVKAPVVSNDTSNVRVVKYRILHRSCCRKTRTKQDCCSELLPSINSREHLTISEQATPETDPTLSFCDRPAFGQGSDEVVTLIKTLESIDSMAIKRQTPAARFSIELVTSKRLLSVATMSVPIFNIWDSLRRTE